MSTTIFDGMSQLTTVLEDSWKLYVESHNHYLILVIIIKKVCFGKFLP